MKNLTLKKVLKRHQKNPQDKAIHEIIESKSVNEQTLDKTLKKSMNKNVVDKN